MKYIKILEQYPGVRHESVLGRAAIDLLNLNLALDGVNGQDHDLATANVHKHCVTHTPTNVRDCTTAARTLGLKSCLYSLYESRGKRRIEKTT
jgi:hypothetical protein